MNHSAALLSANVIPIYDKDSHFPILVICSRNVESGNVKSCFKLYHCVNIKLGKQIYISNKIVT